MFDERRAAQIVAYFIQLHGTSLSILKLVKLVYLADRESLHQYGEPISFDELVSMPFGPVPSQTLNYINGCMLSKVADGWVEWISDKEDYEIGVRKEFPLKREDFDELSDNDIGILNSVWAEFGHMNRWEIRDFTHTLPEWQDPHGSSIPIKLRTIFQAFGLSENEAIEAESEIDSQRALDQVLSN